MICDLEYLHPLSDPSQVAVPKELVTRASILVLPWMLRDIHHRWGAILPIAAAVGHPLGSSKPTLKAIEATSCIKDGASRLEICPNSFHLHQMDRGVIKQELLEIVRAARATRANVQLDAVIDLSVTRPTPELLQTLRESAMDGVVLRGQMSLNDLPAIQSELKGLLLKVQANSISDWKETGVDRIGIDGASARFCE